MIDLFADGAIDFAAMKHDPDPARLLFIYGSLLRGEVSAHRMAGATYVGSARTRPLYTLHRVDWYPALATGGVTAVAGELYRVPPAVLAALDAYEGDDYALVEVELDDGTRAESYVMASEVAHGLAVIPSGDWRRR